MKKVSGSKVVTTAEASELPLPAEIQEALGPLVRARPSTPRRQPRLTCGGICDARGSGGAEGFRHLHDALTNAEANARLAGVTITRLSA